MAYGYTAGRIIAIPNCSSLAMNPNVTGLGAVMIWMARTVTITTDLRFYGWTGRRRDRAS